jgi:hypothetical protein
MEIYGFFCIIFTACTDTGGVPTSNIHSVDGRSNGAIFQLFESGSWLEIERMDLQDPPTLPRNESEETLPHCVIT